MVTNVFQSELVQFNFPLGRKLNVKALYLFRSIEMLYNVPFIQGEDDREVFRL